MSVNHNEFVREAVRLICGNLEIERAIEQCLEFLSSYLPIDSIQLLLTHEELNLVQVVHTASLTKGPEVGTLMPYPTEDQSIRDQRWPELEGIWLINEPESDSAIRGFCLANEISLDISLMVLRLTIADKEIGKLTVKTDGSNGYTIEHARLIFLLREPFAIVLSNSLRHQEIQKLKNMLSSDYKYLQHKLQRIAETEIIGADFGLRTVMDKVHQVASMESPVLLLGETGVGKEVIANAIHTISQRRHGPFIRVNCGAIAASLIDSELFGHEKGAFTGAGERKIGKFERADGGTLFLDEIGELPAEAQVRLLHVLQKHEIERVGGSGVVPINIRIIFATHRNLEEMVAEGAFRMDLYFRLNVFPIVIPPLRQRKGDLPALIHHFIEDKAIKLRVKQRPRIPPGTLERLQEYDWPGNVRELENMIERALIQCHDEWLNIETSNDNHTYLHHTNREKKTVPDNTFQTLQQVTIAHIENALRQSNGKISGRGSASELLGLAPSTLRKKMDKLQIPYRKGIR